MDYSFERAFTIQEKQFMLAYKVSIIQAKLFLTDLVFWILLVPF